MKKVFIVSILLNFLFASAVTIYIIKRISDKPTDNRPFFNKWNDLRNDVLQGQPIDSASIVFVGTSLTEGFPLNEMYAQLPIKNRGISGNNTDNILERLPAILERRPRKLFIEVGSNDVEHEDEFYSNYLKILSLLLQSKRIAYIQSVPPVCKDKSTYQPTINKMNTWLKNKCDSLGIPFIDISGALLKNGTLDSSLTNDGIHLNNKGYQLWKKAIDSLVI